MPTGDDSILAHAVAREAVRLGFDAVGFAPADEPLTVDFERWRAFVAEGYQGEMTWLGDSPDARLRLDGESVLPGARSVVVVARSYRRGAQAEAGDPDLARGIARYARGQDYHNFLRKRLRRLAAFLRGCAPGVQARPLVDDAPILERAWAARAGLGFVGKNGMLIVPGLGSMVLLGEVVTTLALPRATPIEERCGTCTRCLEACPTQAFPRPFVLDARRCIAYLTIEQRGPVDEPLRAAVGEHLFGCDDCQTVCPYNAGPRVAKGAAAAPFQPLARWSQVTLLALLAADEAAWGELAGGSPLFRASRDGLARNAALVLGNRGDASALPALRAAADGDRSSAVREAARWAVAKLVGPG